MRYTRHAGLAILIIGLLVMGWGVYELAGGRIYQAIHGSEVDHEIDQAIESAPPTPVAPNEAPRPSYKLGSAIGRLDIPRLGMSVVVLEGSESKSLRLGVGRLHNSSFPGEAGNVVLAGHRDTFFRPLKEIRKGDTISMRTPQGTFPYKVEWTEVVDPSDVSVLKRTNDAALTLVTCYPFSWVGSAPQRFIVRASAVHAAPTALTSVRAPASRKESPFAVPVRRSKPVPVKAEAPTPVVSDDSEFVRIALKPEEPAVTPEPPKVERKRFGPASAVRKVVGIFSRRAKIQ